MKFTSLILQILSLGVVAVLAFSSGYLLNETNQTAQARLEKEAALQLKEAPPVEIAVMELKPRPWRETLTYTGVVMPWREADLAFAEGGIVDTLHVDKGDSVKGPEGGMPGAPLATVDRERLKASVMAAEASLKKTSWDLKNQEKLYRNGNAPEEAVKEQETLRDLRESELIQAEKSLADATLRAPFSGTIADRMIELGEAASPQSPAFRLIQLDPVKITVTVPGRGIDKIKKGQSAEVEIQLESGRTRVFKGKVHYIPPAAADLLFAVEIAVENPDGALKEGMIAEARLFGEEQPSLYALPIETVIQVGALRRVMLMDKEGEVVDGYFDLGYLPPVEQGRVLETLDSEEEVPGSTHSGSQDSGGQVSGNLDSGREGWISVSLKIWSSLNLSAVDRLAAKVTSPKVHRLRGKGVRVFHIGPRARMLTLEDTRIEGDYCLVPDNGTFKPGDLLIARGQYRVTDGGEVRVSEGNELSLPGEVENK